MDSLSDQQVESLRQQCHQNPWFLAKMAELFDMQKGTEEKLLGLDHTSEGARYEALALGARRNALLELREIMES